MLAVRCYRKGRIAPSLLHDLARLNGGMHGTIWEAGAGGGAESHRGGGAAVPVQREQRGRLAAGGEGV